MATNFDVELPEEYTVCILDHNVNRVEFNETQLLRLNKDDYEVLESESVNDESEKDNDNESNSDNNN
jgi:hypothetical protein